MVAHERDLTDSITADMGKPAWQALTGDVMTLLAACKWHRKHARALLRDRGVARAWTLLPATRVTLSRQPLGCVAIIATWNYPVQLLGIQLVQALLAGNRVVVKPSEKSPISQLMLLRIARVAGAPRSHLTWTEPTRAAGQSLLERRPAAHFDGVSPDRNWDHVVFTGSTRVGREIAQWAAANLVSTTLELSGNDSAIVLADADVALAARSIFAGFTLNAGQTCLAPRRVIVHRRVADGLLSELAALVMNHTPVRLADQVGVVRCVRLVEEALSGGPPARVLAGSAPTVASSGGSDAREGENNPSAGVRDLRPTIVVDPPRESDLVTSARCDHFGPVLAVVPVDSLSEAIAVHRSCGQHLSASVFTRDERAARELAPSLGASLVTINDCVIPGGHPGLAITGHGPSGWGPSRGAEGLLAMTRGLYVSSTGTLRPPVGPLDDAMVGRLRAVLGFVFGRAEKRPLDASE